MGLESSRPGLTIDVSRLTSHAKNAGS